MTLDEIKKQWRAKLEKYRDERDWLLKHKYPIEAASLDKVVQVIWEMLSDLDHMTNEEA